MIKVKHLNKAFGSIPVLRDLNLTVNGPLVLMGPSGCGKTTLLRILMGLETPDSGTVQGVGNIGAVFQECRLCPQLTAVGNICLVGGVNPAQAQAELQTLGFTQVELGVFADNERAIGLYRKLGFTEMGRIPKAFCLKDGTYRDEAQMVKFL